MVEAGRSGKYEAFPDMKYKKMNEK